MASAKPGGRKYLSEIKLMMGLGGVNSTKRGLADVNSLISSLAFGTKTFKTNVEMAKEEVKSMTYSVSDRLYSLQVQYDAVSHIVAGMAQGIDPLALNHEELLMYNNTLINMAQLLQRLEKIEDLSEYGISKEELDSLKDRVESAELYKEQLLEASVVQKHLVDIQGELADAAKPLSEVYRMASEEVGNIFNQFTNVNESTRTFFSIIGKSASVLKVFSKTITDELKKVGSEFVKQSLSRAIYKKIPELQAAAKKFASSQKELISKDSAKQLATTAQQTGELAGGVQKMAGNMAAGGKTAQIAAGHLARFGASAQAGGLSVGALTGGIGALATAITGPLAIAIGVAIAVIAGMVAVLAAISEGIKSNIKIMEKYRQASFRAMGSIRELTDATFDLSVATGLSIDESSESIKALSQAGFAFSSLGEGVQTASGQILTNNEALSRLATTNAKFSKATGMSATETAKLQKMLSVTNVSVEDQEALFGKAAIAAEKYGLTGEELSSALGLVREQAILLNDILVDTDFQKYTDGILAMASATKKMGLDANQGASLMKDVLEGADRMQRLAGLGGQFGVFMDADASNNLEGVISGVEQLREMLKSGGRQQIVAKNLMESMGVTAQDLALLEEAYKTQQNMTEEERNAVEQAKALDKIYKDSLASIGQAMQRLFAPVLAAVAKVLGPAVDYMVEMFQGIEKSGIAKAFAKIVDVVIYSLSPVGDMIGETFSLIKELGVTIWLVLEPLLPLLKIVGRAIMTTLVGPIRVVVGLFRLINVVLMALASVWNKFATPLIETLSIPILFLQEWSSSISNIIKFGEDAFDWIYGQLEKAAAGFSVLGTVISALTKPIKAVWDALTGSSMFHIKESINEDLNPALKILYAAFEYLTSPIQAVKNLISAAFGPEVLARFEKKIMEIKDNIKAWFGWLIGDEKKEVKVDAKVSRSETIDVPKDVEVKAGRSEPVDVQETIEVQSAQIANAMEAYAVAMDPELQLARNKMLAQMAKTDEEIRGLLEIMVSKMDDGPEATNENTRKLGELVEVQKEKRVGYPRLTSGFGEKTNLWFTR